MLTIVAVTAVLQEQIRSKRIPTLKEIDRYDPFRAQLDLSKPSAE